MTRIMQYPHHDKWRLLNHVFYRLRQIATQLRLSCMICSNHRTQAQGLCQQCLTELRLSTNKTLASQVTIGPQRAMGTSAEKSGSRHQRVDIRSVFSYQGLVRYLLVSLKYQQGLWVIPILANPLADAIVQEGQCQYAVIPMPMHWRRRFEQGYNPPNLLANWVAYRSRSLIYDRLLVRIRHRPPQQTLRRADRLHNVSGCFRTRGQVPEHIVLIDDVATTGATLREAKACLIAAGAKEVVCWVVAQTKDSEFTETAPQQLGGDRISRRDSLLGYDAEYGL